MIRYWGPLSLLVLWCLLALLGPFFPLTPKSDRSAQHFSGHGITSLVGIRRLGPSLCLIVLSLAHARHSS